MSLLALEYCVTGTDKWWRDALPRFVDANARRDLERNVALLNVYGVGVSWRLVEVEARKG